MFRFFLHIRQSIKIKLLSALIFKQLKQTDSPQQFSKKGILFFKSKF